jgi:hypothetical protein
MAIEIPSHVVDWLVGEDNPPVRYLTLTKLLRRSPRTKSVSAARARLMDYGVTQGILRHARELVKSGDHDLRRYLWKYNGTCWQLIFLGQFLADGKHPRIAELAEGVLAQRGWVAKGVAHCLTANVLTALMRLGFAEHPVVVGETESLAKRVLADDGIDCRTMDYCLLSRCQMAQPKLLLCFAEVRPEKRSAAVVSATKLLVENLLKTQVYIYVPGTLRQWQQLAERRPKRADLPSGQTAKGWLSEQRTKFLSTTGLGTRQPKKGWEKFAFPLHYNSDILEAMYSLALLGIPMKPQLRRPLKVIREKMTPDGTWLMEDSLNGKMLVDVEEKGKPSKWVTYLAYHVLKHFDGQ